MNILADLEPASVFSYFEEICSIPHGSRDTKRISDYLAGFAAEHGLSCIQDEYNNIIIKKPGSAGRESEVPVIIQGHMDMVCEKEPDCDIDFSTDGLRLKIENGMITADGTTLGGDDGIAVAYALAILDSDTISHPPIEAVITVDEEIGMLGAAALDMSVLEGRRLLNIDSEDEGHLLVSCAGGVTASVNLPIESQNMDALYNDPVFIKLSVTGLMGGHSGVEIDKGRANSNVLLGRALYEISGSTAFNLKSVSGGLKDNAIPRMSEAVLVTDRTSINKIKDICEALTAELHAEYSLTDPEILISIEETPSSEALPTAMTTESGRRVITAIYNMPSGIQNMSFSLPGLVETSLNMGILFTKADKVVMSYSVRSSVGSRKDELVNRLRCLAEALGGTVTTEGAYPAWEYLENSPLREAMISVYEDMYKKKPVIESIHAGVECGLFADGLPGLDAVSFGPDIHDIHTPKEALDIESVKRTWEYILKVLEVI